MQQHNLLINPPWKSYERSPRLFPPSSSGCAPHATIIFNQGNTAAHGSTSKNTLDPQKGIHHHKLSP